MKDGDWIDGFDGIGQVVSIHEIYADELHLIGHGDRNFGDHVIDIVVYKMFCSFDGKVRKRNHFLSCNKSYCSPLSEQSTAVLDKVKEQESEHYRKYLTLRASKSIGGWSYYYLPCDESFESYKEKIEATGKNIPKPFAFFEYKEALSKIGFNVGLGYAKASIKKPYVTLSFFNEGYLSKKRVRVFSHVNCTVIE